MPSAEPVVGADPRLRRKRQRRRAAGAPTVMQASGIIDYEAPWHASARCKETTGSVTRLFFSEDYNEIFRARRICEACNVRRECLSAAIARKEHHGVWGGELMRNGRPREPRRVGRPPLVQRLPIFADEVPFPPELDSVGDG